MGVMCLLALLTGCATRPPAQKVHIFFPPAPDEPRIQYLTGFGSESDLGGRSWFAEFIVGAEQRIHRPIWKPYGITTSKGRIYICDTQAANVGTVDLARRTLRFLRPAGEAAMSLPLNIAVDSDGTKYVADGKRRQVLIYDSRGQYQTPIGVKDEMRPCGIALAGDKLYVTDTLNHCVRVYRKSDRELLLTVPSDPADEKAKLHAPTNIAVDQQGRMYVTDTGGFAVHVYDVDGKLLRGFGDLGVTPGSFALPKGIGVDREGRVYVVDAATTVVQVFDADSRLLMYFGEPARSGEAALYLPAGLAIDYDNTGYFQKYVAPGWAIEYLILVVNQAGPHKVNVYGYLKKKA
jgi:sugar lactone lactonase YvrE